MVDRVKGLGLRRQTISDVDTSGSGRLFPRHRCIPLPLPRRLALGAGAQVPRERIELHPDPLQRRAVPGVPGVEGRAQSSGSRV